MRSCDTVALSKKSVIFVISLAFSSMDDFNLQRR
jgi:hypothetical protein